ncbi:two-component sensor histidine kinase [Mycolicibacterium moriokaense]|jgi:signal transduction histidine kinase|uniref:histidine kinase n=1 Tax=Mycolicibacterium moriokaense TaxID=39691 RepID=A0AAD1HCV4_9MYCO|nr:HAMP domain-containing sensor histidine kinase [Mycolicibacterium moriokaense]MCV7038368.1 HAMP domain-containing histidine kinase [Mycolicibacterium moriokaense]ORB13669.1 two-component sensor histidine kinase [Mycolicibacterium moriokaense]BBX02510.1 two-component sensor histidine kinase [Mycolicibacterium moriokaense]
MGLLERLYEWLARVLSLRVIVIVAALSVVALVITLGAWVWFGVTNDQYSQLDRRLDSVSSLGDISMLLRAAQGAGQSQAPDGNLVRTARIDGITVSIPKEVVLPEFDVGYANTTIDGVEYRVRTFTAGEAKIAVGAPVAETQRRINELHRRVLLICGGVIIGTVLVGWVMWSIMINPFRLLAQQARAINAQSNPDEVKVRGVQEAVEIAEAVEGMLARIGDEQQRTKAALESARDFAAVASHELRTPLTAMRTNLEVLSTLEMRDDQRQEVIADVMRTQSRIEATLTALERLAQGELTTVDDFVPVDITELLDRAAHDAMRNYPGLKVSLASSTTVLMVGLPAGLRLVIDNAITNAVKHGGATEIRLSAESSGDGVEIAVDDNGSGVPEEERAAVFERFSRGSTAARSGSGLGLALVAQQADLHGGIAAMEASPLGGARLVLRLPAPS